MGQKRTIKQNTEVCFCCGGKFDSYKEKNVYKLNSKKEHSIANTVVLCDGCLKEVTADKSVLYNNFSMKSICKKVNIKKNAELLMKHMRELRENYDNT